VGEVAGSRAWGTVAMGRKSLGSRAKVERTGRFCDPSGFGSFYVRVAVAVTLITPLQGLRSLRHAATRGDAPGYRTVAPLGLVCGRLGRAVRTEVFGC